LYERFYGGIEMKFIKRHRYTCVLVLVFILIVILGFKVKEMLVPDEGKATYGERLKEIDKHPISNEEYEKIDEDFKANNKVVKISHRLQGKILNYYVTVDNSMTVKDAKALGDKIISFLSEDTLGYYSVQIFVVKEDEKENDFPIIGMKDPLSKSISWTKDREKVEIKDTESDENEK
jgi:hypothetical protein